MRNPVEHDRRHGKLAGERLAAGFEIDGLRQAILLGRNIGTTRTCYQCSNAAGDEQHDSGGQFQANWQREAVHTHIFGSNVANFRSSVPLCLDLTRPDAHL